MMGALTGIPSNLLFYSFLIEQLRRGDLVVFCEVLPVLGMLPIAVVQWTKLFALVTTVNFLRADKWNR